MLSNKSSLLADSRRRITHPERSIQVVLGVSAKDFWSLLAMSQHAGRIWMQVYARLIGSQAFSLSPMVLSFSGNVLKAQAPRRQLKRSTKASC